MRVSDFDFAHKLASTFVAEYPEIVCRLGVPKQKVFKDMDYVYFIQAIESNFVKIGSAKNIEKRLSNLQVGCPFELKLINYIYGRSQEVNLHKRFQAYHVRGEWFTLEGELKQFIDNLEPPKPAGGRGWMYTDYYDLSE